MPNSLGPNGLTIKTRAEIIDEMLNGTDGIPGMYEIYGADANFDPNTPDGNWLNITAQQAIDYLELLLDVFTSMDPDQAVGTTLDQRCAINGVVRKAGTYTTQLVTVTATQAVTLPGLDTAPTAPFVVQDAAGNRFDLVTAHAFGGAGSADLLFQAEQIGAVLVTANTLTTIATPTKGVASVTNGTLSGTTGVNEELDAALRQRRRLSVSLPSQGFLEGLYGALLAVAGVTNVKVLENDTGSTDGYGVPAHSIWAIVNGGANADVAYAIYVKRNAGCGMEGSVSVSVARPGGATIAIKFDRPTEEDLWISFNLTPITGSIDQTYIKTQIAALLAYDIGQGADASAITALVKTLAPNAYVDSMGVSNINGSYVAFISPTGVNYQWGVSTARILINGV